MDKGELMVTERLLIGVGTEEPEADVHIKFPVQYNVGNAEIVDIRLHWSAVQEFITKMEKVLPIVKELWDEHRGPKEWAADNCRKFSLE